MVGFGKREEALFKRLWELHSERTRAFYEDLDAIAAERLVEKLALSKAGDPGTVEKVKEILSKAYSSGPFRGLKPAEAAQQISRILRTGAEEVRAEILSLAPRFDRSFAPAFRRGMGSSELKEQILDILRSSGEATAYEIWERLRNCSLRGIHRAVGSLEGGSSLPQLQGCGEQRLRCTGSA